MPLFDWGNDKNIAEKPVKDTGSLFDWGTKSTQPVVKPTQMTPTPVQKSVDNVFNRLGGAFSNLFSGKLPDNKTSKSMEFPVITGPTPEVIDTQAKDLETRKKTLNVRDSASIDDYNSRVAQFNKDLTQYNTASKAQEILSKKNTAKQYTAGEMVSHDLSQILNEPIKGFGEALGNTKVFEDMAKNSDEGKFLPSFVESLANHLQYGTDTLSGLTGGIIQPEKYNTDNKDTQDFASKLVSVFSQGVGMAGAIGGIEEGVFSKAGAPKAILQNLKNYPRIAEYVNSLARSIPAFVTYGQLNPNLNTLGERVKQMGNDILVSVPYTALGLLKNKALMVPASAALGFGMAKLEGASNKDAAISATTLGLLSLMGATGKNKGKEVITREQAQGDLRRQAVETLNKYSTKKITETSTEKDVKEAYKEAAMKTHPDLGGESKDFSAITYARDILIEKPKSTEAEMTGRKTPEEAKADVQDISTQFRKASKEDHVTPAGKKVENKGSEGEPLTHSIDKDGSGRISTKGGRVDFYTEGDKIIVSDLYVSKSERQKGVGSSLLQEVEKIAKEQNKDVQLSPIKTENNTPDLVNFYEKRGYVKNGSGESGVGMIKDKLKFNEKGREKLPEVPAEPARITEYKERLKIRGADPVLVDAIITPSGNRAYGVSVGGRISLERVVEQFTEDHEVFHQIFQNFEKMRVFEKFDKEALLSEAKALYGDLPDAQLEEEMAKDFQQYVKEKESGKDSSFFGKIREFFERLLASVKRIFKNPDDIKEFYRTMTEGKAKEETVINDEMPEVFNKKVEEGVLDFRIQNDVANFLQETPVQEAFTDSGDLTLKTITKLEGRTTVSKQFILDSTNSPGITQPERDLVRALLETEGDTVNVQEFADKVKAELLPLNTDANSLAGTPMYEYVSLPDDIKGNVADYFEKVYQSPIPTSAGKVHFQEMDAMGQDAFPKNYFGHTRIEDMQDLYEDENGGLGEKQETRRVIEVQSDLYQKGNLDKEVPSANHFSKGDTIIYKSKSYTVESTQNGRTAATLIGSDGETLENIFVDEVDPESIIANRTARRAEISKLSQYNNPTAHFRMVREEIRRAAQDGKMKLQFPTGETAMKIEGLGQVNRWYHVKPETMTSGSELAPSQVEVGKIIADRNGDFWVITDSLGDGKFKATQKLYYDKVKENHPDIDPLSYITNVDKETFDISGKVDTNNPIYRFYEKDLARYLKNNYNAKPVTDEQGVTWMEVPIQDAYGDLPVPAFNEKQELDEDGNPVIRYDEDTAPLIEKNPIFDTGSKLEDVQKTLEHAEARVGMTKAQRVEDAAQRAIRGEDFGPKPERKAKVPKFDTGNVLTDIRATLAHSEVKNGLRQGPMKVSVPKSDLSPELINKQIELQIRREALDENPLKNLIKYSNKREGTLPEVSGGAHIRGVKEKVTSKFGLSGDDIISRSEFDRFSDAQGNISTEIIRDKFEGYMEARKELSEEERQFNKDVKEYKEKRRAEILEEKDKQKLDAMADQAAKLNEREAYREKQRQEQAIAYQKVLAEAEKKQNERNKIEENFTKPPESGKINPLTPVKSLDAETQRIYKKFANTMNESKVVGLKYANSMPQIDKLGKKAFFEFEQGELPQQDKISEIFDSLFWYAKKNGFTDLNYEPLYLPHVYKNTQDVDAAIRRSLEDKGLSESEIEAYMNGKKISDDKSIKLKLNPFFSKERFFPTYEDAMTYGLMPKFDKMSDLIKYYHQQLLQTAAARTLIEDLTDSAKIVPESVAPKDWRPVAYGPQGIKGYWASPKLANFLDGIFRGHEDLGLFDPTMIAIANLSRFGQNLALSGGVPFTNLNFFSFGIVNKEMVRGNLKAFNAWIKSNSNKATVRSLQKDYPYIEMMVHNGIPFRSISGVKPQNYETIRAKWGKFTYQLKKIKTQPGKLASYKPLVTPSTYSPFFEIIGQGVDKVFGEKTFNNFLPLLYVQVYKDSYLSLVKQGVPEQEAQIMAASLTKMSQGIVEDTGRSELTQDKLTALFFAPVYRESIINVLLNTGKSVIPVTYKKANGETGEKGGFKKGPLFDSKFKFNRRLLAGMIIMLGVYDLLNKKLNGHHLWQNPKGHEFDVRIPLPNGQVGYVPFMPGFLSLPRAIWSGGSALAQGDINLAVQKFGSSFSMVVKTSFEVLSNRNYFGNPIYKDTDSRKEKMVKVAKYIGLEFNHPYVAELVNQLTADEPKPLYQSIVTATEMPLKFSTEKKEATSKFYDAIDKKAQERANMTDEIRPTYEKIQELKAAGNIREAQEMHDKLTPEEKELYKNMKTSDKRNTTLSTEVQIYNEFTKIQTLKSEGKIEEANKIYSAFTPAEKHAYQLLKNKLK